MFNESVDSKDPKRKWRLTRMNNISGQHTELKECSYICKKVGKAGEKNT